MKQSRLSASVLCALLLFACAARAVDFDREIAPIFAAYCLDCHSGAEPKGKLDLSRRQGAMAGGKDGVAIVPGDLDKSPMWELIDDGEMPPKKELPAPQREAIRAWIAGGAKWGTDPIDSYRATTGKRAGYDWWSLQALHRPAVPVIGAATQPVNPIDAFIRERLEKEHLTTSPPTDRRTLIRRLYFDLIGLPPSPDEADAFIADTSPDAYGKLVDRLLASPEYGVRWARHWLDVARYGESNGFEHDEFRPNAWTYRDWVVDALNRDMPYDEFARLQLAGDLIHPHDASAITATGFLVAGAYDSVGQTQQSELMRRVVRQDELEDIVGTVGQAFLGLSVQCARCHDHKFDPIHQVEYYRMTAALGGVRQGERQLPIAPERLERLRHDLASATESIGCIEGPVRESLVALRKASPIKAPVPVALWDFRSGGEDRIGQSHAALKGGAKLMPDGLRLNGTDAYALASFKGPALVAKTLEAWVRLDNLTQRAGGVISIQAPGGTPFDAIVFGERDAGQWMAGSEGFARWKSFGAPREADATQKFVHVAMVYFADGRIAGYRNGAPYGQSYLSAGAQGFKAGEAEIVFGLRHSPAGAGKMLAGTIQRAALYEGALSAQEVAAAAQGVDVVTPAEIAAKLEEPTRTRYQALRSRVAELQAAIAAGGGLAHAVAPQEPGKSFLLIRGNTKQPGEAVAAGGVAAISGPPADFGLSGTAPEKQCRLKFAEWVTAPANPLFSRVIVNRLWHYHFGTGLVDTPNDFGFNGGRPTHPELLDYLASELIARKFSLKQMHRVIVTSETYRQSSRFNDAAAKADAGNRLLWRKSPRRLEAEVLRDAVLGVSGKLNLAHGGPGFKDFKVSIAVGHITNHFDPVEELTNDMFRRTLYRSWARGGRNGLLDALDCPDPSATAPARQVTNTPLQALAMLNNATILRMADEFAARLQAEAPDSSEARIKLAYRYVVNRLPDARELAAAQAVVDRHGLNVLARALFNSSEFVFVD